MQNTIKEFIYKNYKVEGFKKSSINDKNIIALLEYIQVNTN
jgi:hypothetical protein